MKKPRTTAIAALAIGLLAASSVGVVAQEAPSEFTAEWRFGPPIESGERVADGDVVRWRGEVWRPSTAVEATDPRFRGDLSNSWNHDDYPDGSAIGAVTFTVSNGEGAWIMEPALALDFPGSQYWPPFGAVFVGEGAYEGLLALADIETADRGFHLRGYIVDETALPTLEAYRP